MFPRYPSPLAWVTAAGAILGFGCGDDEASTRFTVEIVNVAPEPRALSVGRFDTPVGENSPFALGPGQSYRFTFDAPPRARLSLATMLVPSNDFFVAPAEREGLALFDSMSGVPVEGDVTRQLALWDAGTEANQPLGEGDTQANDVPGQGQGMRGNFGPPDSDANVRRAQAPNLPRLDDILALRIAPRSSEVGVVTTFDATLQNLSDESSLRLASGGSRAVLFTQGLYVVHGPEQPAPLFEPGSSAGTQGLESLVEDGTVAPLETSLRRALGPLVALSPGVFAVFPGDNPLFTISASASAGLERLAEDGDPAGLRMEMDAVDGLIASGAFERPDGAAEAEILRPGQAYRFSFTAVPPARLSFVSMYTESNDVFVSLPPSGVTLFNGDVPIGGALSGLALFDAGTEVNETPGFGPNQAPRQRTPNSGEPEGGSVALLEDASGAYGAADAVARVTIASAPEE